MIRIHRGGNAIDRNGDMAGRAALNEPLSPD